MSKFDVRAMVVSQFPEEFQDQFKQLCENNSVNLDALGRYTEEHIQNVLEAGQEGNWHDFLRDCQAADALGHHQQTQVSKAGLFGHSTREGTTDAKPQPDNVEGPSAK